MTPNSDSPGTRAKEVVYYPGPDIVVTSRHIITKTDCYPVRDLRVVERVMEYRYPTVKVAAICSAVEFMLAVPVAAVYGSALLLCAGLLTAVGMAAAIITDGRRNPRWMAVRARYGTAEVTLYSTRSWQDFQLVRWAIIRAVEDNRPPRV